MASDSEIRAWALDRGAEVSKRGRVSAELRAEYEQARPGPAADGIAEDAGIIDVDDDLLAGGHGPSAPGSGGQSPLPPDPDEPSPDEPPGHARREWRKPPRTRAQTKKPPPRVTAGVRQDIEAKIGFGLEIFAQFWQVRDPLCGAVAAQQVPATAQSFTNWVMRSPALIDWFTSPAGSGFMLVLDTAAAVGPVISVVMAHHVYHSVDTSGPDEPQDGELYKQYAA